MVRFIGYRKLKVWHRLVKTPDQRPLFGTVNTETSSGSEKAKTSIISPKKQMMKSLWWYLQAKSSLFNALTISASFAKGFDSLQVLFQHNAGSTLPLQLTELYRAAAWRKANKKSVIESTMCLCDTLADVWWGLLYTEAVKFLVSSPK